MIIIVAVRCVCSEKFAPIASKLRDMSRLNSKEESGFFKLIPRLGRRAGHSSSIQEEKSDDDRLDSPESLSSGKSSAKPMAPPVPPRARKAGWGDELKSAKQRGISAAIEDRVLNNDKHSREDDIPVIPDLDEIIEDTSTLNISNAPPAGVNRAAAAYKELDSDLVKNKLLSIVDDVDLSLLTKKLYPEHLVREPDEVWTWDGLFAQVVSEINSESQTKSDETDN